MNKEKIKLGIAPIGWTNDDMPDLGGEITFEQCISEMALAGFEGCEIGNKFPKDIEKLKKALKLRNLQIANRWFSSYILTKQFDEVEKDFRQNCKFLTTLGAEIIGVSEQSYSIQGQINTPVFENKYELNDEQWKALCQGLCKLGKIAKEYGITLTYHHHMGTVVQTVEEIDKLMEGTDSELIFLLYDSGHLAYCQEDYIGVLKKYANRIKHVHLKDIRDSVVEKVRAERLSFLQGVRLGTFTVPGDGTVDFESIFNILDKTNYTGWLIVEAEQDPSIANPLEYALKTRAYIKEKTKI
ncbi:MAG: myo-inosose-2 dehydratase [Clostridiales bacterium]|nr:myo-inosose-2 dehydratase [Clostridiales bacterium]